MPQVPMITHTNAFASLARSLGASLVYAPLHADEPLNNSGSVPLEPGQLNGATLASPGLYDDAPAAFLDGANDYIDTGFATRSNGIRDPLFLSGTPWSSVVGTSCTDLGSGIATMPDAAGRKGWRVRQKKDNSATNRAMGLIVPISGAGKYLAAAAPGDVWTVSAEAFTADDAAGEVTGSSRGLRAQIIAYKAALGTAIQTFTGAIVEDVVGKRVSFSCTATMPAETAFIRVELGYATNAAEDVVDGYIVNPLLQKAATPAVFFPTPDEIASGVAAQNSETSPWETGPLVSQADRTFVLAYERTDESAERVFFGGNTAEGSEAPYLLFRKESPAIRFFDGTGSSYQLSATGAEVGQRHVLALVRSGGEVKLYVDGVLAGTHASTAWSYSGDLLLGNDRAGGGAPFLGRLLPFAAFPAALTEGQIGSLATRLVSGPELSPVISVREFPRLDLHYEIQTPNGRFYRWAKDEVRPENVPSGASFSTTDHGGFDSQNLTLPRKPGVDYADLQRLSTVRALGAGGEVACETRLKEAPRTSGDQIAVSPAAEGWIAHLEDDQTAAEVYVDRDLSGWQSPSRARSVALEGESFNPGGPEVLTDAASGVPSLKLSFSDSWTMVRPIAEAVYDAGPNVRIAKMINHWSVVGAAASNTAFVLLVFNAEDDANTGVSYGADLFTSGTEGEGIYEPASPRRVIGWQWYFSTTASGIDGTAWTSLIGKLAMLGNHGLTVQGSGTSAGLFGSDVLADAFGRWAPLLNFSTGPSGTIRPGSFVIPHLSFKEQTTSLAILEGVNRFELRPYYVYENRTFYWEEWGERRKWRARVAPTQLSETGPSTDRLRNGVLLKWNDVDGTTRSAGPIGSGSDIESAELEDRDPENPANQLGARMWGAPYDLGIVTVVSEAIRIGVLLQARLKEVDRSGQAQIVGVCEDDKGVVRPYWQVRAGDTITFIDAADTSERRIIATQPDDDSLTNTITLDAPADGTDDLLAQLGVGNTELGL